MLEGLGPPKEHAPGTKSFKDQVRLLISPHCFHMLLIFLVICMCPSWAQVLQLQSAVSLRSL